MEKQKYLVHFCLSYNNDDSVVLAESPEAAAELVRQRLVKCSETPDEPEKVDLVIGEVELITEEKHRYRVDINIYDDSDDGRHLAYGDDATFEVEADLDGSECSDSPQSHASEEKTALEVMRLWATKYLEEYPALERDRQMREGTERRG